MDAIKSAAKQITIPITLALICWLIYRPGLEGDFIFDDSPNIINNKSIALQSLNLDDVMQAAQSGTAGPLLRPVSMLSFALNHYLTGFDSYWFKATNLLIHYINGIGVFLLSYLLLSVYQQQKNRQISKKHIYYLSAAISLAWLIHPINLTSVLYVVQRMNSLSAAFSLFGMILYVTGRMRQLTGKAGITWIAGSLLIAMPLAVLSKENGALLPALLTVIEITFFRFQMPGKIHRNTLIALHSAIIFTPIAALTYLAITGSGDVLGSYLIRDFTLIERLLTQTRVIWFYIYQIFTPLNTHLGIYHDDIIVSRDLFTPLTTIIAVTGLLALTTAAILAISRAPLFSFGILFFLVGHSLESSILPLELLHEHRNYLPSFSLVFSLLYYLTYPLTYTDTLRIRQISAAILIMVFALVTFNRSNIWSDQITHITFEADNHPNSPRANLEIGQMYMRIGLNDKANGPIYLAAAKHHFQRSSQLSENFLGGLFALLALESTQGNGISKELIDELVLRITHQPFSSNTVNWIDYLGKCTSKGECSIPEKDMHRIIQACLANETIRSRAKANLYTAASNYYFHINDLESALYMAAESASALPRNARYRINLVNMLIILGRQKDAYAELEQVKANDRFGTHASEIERLELIINQLTEQQKNSFE